MVRNRKDALPYDLYVPPTSLSLCGPHHRPFLSNTAAFPVSHFITPTD
uniref:Uncharacterized protein n=1 Tax=Anguilla anguilla TaxID=7936 RepID=A0A0E9VIZ7_ANGAN